MEIVPSDYNGSLHFGWDYYSLKDLASDGDIGSEWTLFIDVFRLNGFFRGFESKSDIFEISNTSAGLFGK